VASDKTQQTAATLNQHWVAIAQGDVEAILRDPIPPSARSRAMPMLSAKRFWVSLPMQMIESGNQDQPLHHVAQVAE
jgi:hypothetical protein